jgi:hypothetical protein
MKNIAEDRTLMIEFVLRVQRAHEMITEAKEVFNELRFALKDIEEIGLTLEGCEVEDVIVNRKVDRIKVEGSEELHIPSWNCTCKCGAEFVASHSEILEGSVTVCHHNEQKGEIDEQSDAVW